MELSKVGAVLGPDDYQGGTSKGQARDGAV